MKIIYICRKVQNIIEINIYKNDFLDNKWNIIQVFSIHAQSYQDSRFKIEEVFYFTNNCYTNAVICIKCNIW